MKHGDPGAICCYFNTKKGIETYGAQIKASCIKKRKDKVCVAVPAYCKRKEKKHKIAVRSMAPDHTNP